MDTNGSIATNHAPAIVSLKSLHVQDKGTFELKAYHDAYTWDIDATNITVSTKYQNVQEHLLNYLKLKKICVLLNFTFAVSTKKSDERDFMPKCQKVAHRKEKVTP